MLPIDTNFDSVNQTEKAALYKQTHEVNATKNIGNVSVPMFINVDSGL